jgi:hypothetical protein
VPALSGAYYFTGEIWARTGSAAISIRLVEPPAWLLDPPAIGNNGAQIGASIAGPDWVASNLVAGTQNLGVDDNPRGAGANAEDVNIGDTHGTLTSSGSVSNCIDSVVIGGQRWEPLRPRCHHRPQAMSL